MKEHIVHHDDLIEPKGVCNVPSSFKNIAYANDASIRRLFSSLAKARTYS